MQQFERAQIRMPDRTAQVGFPPATSHPTTSLENSTLPGRLPLELDLVQIFLRTRPQPE
jgi:hypothetical protein